MSSGKEAEFSESVSRWCGAFGKGDRVFRVRVQVVSSGKEPSFLILCPRGVVSSGNRVF